MESAAESDGERILIGSLVWLVLAGLYHGCWQVV